jgi:diguanylate cyclase (GGDEF)-like protein/PAS domain S-box-containing protein
MHHLDTEHYLERELRDLLADDTEVFEFLVGGTLDGVWYWDLTQPDHGWVTPALWELLGHDPAGRTHRISDWQGLMHPDDRVGDLAALEAHLADPTRPLDQVVRFRHVDGHLRWMRVRGLAVRDDLGRAVRLLATHQDVTELEQAERQLRARTVELERTGARLRAVFDHSAVAAALVSVAQDDEGRILDRNQALVALCDADPADLAEVLDPARAAEVVEALRRLVRDGVVPLDVECPLGGTRPRWVRLLAAPVPMMEPGALPTAVVQLEDVTERHLAFDRLRYLSGHDQLTGLVNRSGFVEMLEHALARQRRDGTHVGVVLVDLDHFKVVNEALGHETGDRVLLDVAARLTRVVRGGDVVARLGGDEFAVLSEPLDVDRDRATAQVESLAHRVLDAVSATVTLDDTTTQLAASVGVRLAGVEPVTAATLLADADMAMYRAKQRGRRQVVHHHVRQRRAVEDLLRLEHDLRHSLLHRRLHVAYQPVVDLESGEVVGAEALARWNHPTLGPLPPDRFVPLAERTGLVVELGELVALHACADLATRPGWDGPRFRVSVNVAAAQLSAGDLAGTLIRLLDRHELRPGQLAVELTETVLVEATEHTHAQLEELDRAGIAVGIDDFGTGFGSFTYLHRFPISFIKVDRGFVAGLGENEEDAAIVAATVDLGRSLGLEVVAEGVERPEQARLLRRLGCTLAQGFHLGHPGPAERLRTPTG